MVGTRWEEGARSGLLFTPGACAGVNGAKDRETNSETQLRRRCEVYSAGLMSGGGDKSACCKVVVRRVGGKWISAEGVN